MDIDKENVGNISFAPAAPMGLFVKQQQPQPVAVSGAALPQLMCQAPPRPVMVGFGCASANCEHVKRVVVVNPSASDAADLRIQGTTLQGKKLPEGLRIVFEDSGSSTSMKLSATSTAVVSISWKAAPGTALNDTAVVLMNNAVKLPIFLSGVATAAGKGAISNSSHSSAEIKVCI